MSFAVSMTDPPPRARKAVGLYSLAKSIASPILFLTTLQYLNMTRP